MLFRSRPKAGLNWKPYRGLMVRASYNQGFAAPNLPTLYAPTRFTVDSAPGQTDVYRNQTVGNATYVMKRYSTGNLALQPVTSVGKSAGVVLEVPVIKGLTVTADYWQIDQSNVIGSYSDSQLFNSDAAKLNAFIQSQLAAGKTIEAPKPVAARANVEEENRARQKDKERAPIVPSLVKPVTQE